jgi:ATP-dependent DNA ligase
MEAQLVARIPKSPGWLYQPKWDGFRCLVFRDGPEVELQSKAGKPLGRYFPEVVARVGAIAAERFVLDGEIVVPVQGAFSFDDLLQRIHPAESRINRLAREHPATLVVFDLLVDEAGAALVEEALTVRQPRLNRFARRHLAARPGITLSESTVDPKAAAGWLASGDVNLDGVIAKRLDAPYRSGERTGMQKVKRVRTADCVVGGFRYSESSYADGRLRPRPRRQIGSLLLGLYEDGLLHHVGFCSGLDARERESLVDDLERLQRPPGFTGRAPGGPSRWSTERSVEWQPLAPELVVEVRWDHFTGGRFRHGTRLLRWRPDKRPDQCSMDQVRQNARE